MWLDTTWAQLEMASPYVFIDGYKDGMKTRCENTIYLYALSFHYILCPYLAYLLSNLREPHNAYSLISTPLDFSMDTDDFAWLAFEDGSFDATAFMSHGHPIVQHNLTAYPLSCLEPEQAQGENSQVRQRALHKNIQSTPSNETWYCSSAQDMDSILPLCLLETPQATFVAAVHRCLPLNSPHLPGTNSPKIQTATKSPTRNSTMSGISAPHHRFTCQLCSFSTNKGDYSRHLETRKHRNNANIGLEGMDERPTGWIQLSRSALQVWC